MLGEMLQPGQIIWRPVVPGGWLVLIALVLGVLAVAAYRRKRITRALPLLLMRITAITALIVLLLGPSIVPASEQEPTRPGLTILLDTSRSMLTEDAHGRSRIQHVLDYWLTAGQLAKLREQYDVKLTGFDKRVRGLTNQTLQHEPGELATGDETNYADSLSAALLDEHEPGAVLLIGDGHDSERRPLAAAAALAQKRNVPIHTLPVGSDVPQRDVAVVAVPRQDYLLAKETGQILVRVHQAGYDGQTATLHLRGPGVDERRKITFAGESATLELPIRHDSPGMYEYVVSLEPMPGVPGEQTVTNNHQIAFVEVTEQRIRVLILEGEPYWDTRFIAQSLRRDPNIELVQISQLSQQRRQDVVTRSEADDVTVPRTAEEFGQYDVVVLGSGLEHVLDTAGVAALDEYVWRGGGQVIFARGRAYDPQTPGGAAIGAALHALEPVDWGFGFMHEMPVSLTASGRGSPAFSFLVPGAEGDELIAQLPPMMVAPVVEGTKPATIVLANFGAPSIGTATAAPAIVTMNYGRGSVFAVLGEGLWQWGFLPPELKEHAGVFAQFWTSVVRWLAMGGAFQPGQELSLKLSRSSVRLGDPLLIDVATRGGLPEDFSPTLTLIDPAGRAMPLELSGSEGVVRRFQANFTPATPGRWRVTVEAPQLNPSRLERGFSVYDLDLEKLHAAARPQVLAELSQRTGGTLFDADQPTDIAARLKREAAARIVPPQPRYAWDTGLILAALVTWMGLEWLGRRQAGWL